MILVRGRRPQLRFGAIVFALRGTHTESSIEPTLRKRASKSVLPPQRHERRIYQAAVREIIACKFKGSRTAAAALGLTARAHSMVSYWLGLMRGLEPACYEPAFESEATTEAAGITPLYKQH
eukprot:6198046-Pleurochrysis_carterae.AAC.4